MNGCGNRGRAHNYVSRKQRPMNAKYVDGSVGAMVRMMVRGGLLLVRGSTRMTLKYDDICRVCGEGESEKHALLDCIFLRGCEKMMEGKDGCQTC